VPRALFVCYGGGHAKMVLAVVRALARDAAWEPVVLGLTIAGPQLRAAGVDARGYVDLVGPGDGEALAHGRRILGDSHDPRSGIAVEESVAYLGLSYQDLVERLGAAGAGDLYRENGRHAFLQLGPMRRAMVKWRPDVVVTTNSPKSERAALVVAREAGIATVAMEDLLGIRQALIRDFVPPFRADRLCVGSTIAIENLERDEGAPREACRLTGNPQFDRIAAVPGRRAAARASLGLAEGDRYAVLYTQTGPDLARLRALVGGLDGPRSLRIGVRRHPNFRASPAADVRAALPANAELVDDADLDDLLAAADIAMSVSSTVVVEALLAGNVVAQLGPELTLSDPPREHLDDLPLHRYGATVLAEDLPTLRALVAADAGSRGEDARERARSLFVQPGTAATAIADQIREVAAST
jgi:hypothetical protein